LILAGLRNLCKFGAIGESFNDRAHLVDLSSKGFDTRKYNTTGFEFFVWKLKPYSVTSTLSKESSSKGIFTFSALGNGAPLYVRPRDDESSGSLSIPMAI
jgi:hypothetical protein